MEEKLKPDDIGCHICLEILYEPITMPCHHRMCKVSILLISLLISYALIDISNKIHVLNIQISLFRPVT